MTYKKTTSFDLFEYFKNPITNRQRQYEAVRAVVVEKESPKTAAKRFGYKAEKQELFPSVTKGPKQRRT